MTKKNYHSYQVHNKEIFFPGLPLHTTTFGKIWCWDLVQNCCSSVVKQTLNNFHLKSLIKNCKSSCILKICLFGWVFNSTIFWQLEAAKSCEAITKKVKKLDKGLQIKLYATNDFTADQLLTDVKLWNFVLFMNSFGSYNSSCVSNLSILGCVKDTLPVGWSAGYNR